MRQRGQRQARLQVPRAAAPAMISTWMLLGLLLCLGGGRPSPGAPRPAERLVPGEKVDPSEIVRRVNARDDGRYLSQVLTIEVVDAQGRTRERTARTYRRHDASVKQSLIRYTSPSLVRGTAFLTYDHRAPEREDDQWLYLPELRRVRRISAADRGQAFLGTDFTYENIKNETKIAEADYDWSTLGWQTSRDCQCIVVEGTVKTAAIGHELGHARTMWWIDTETWLLRRIEYWSAAGERQRTIVATEFDQVQGIWTQLVLTCQNHETGGVSIFRFADIDYQTSLGDDVFSQDALQRGSIGD